MFHLTTVCIGILFDYDKNLTRSSGNKTMYRNTKDKANISTEIPNTRKAPVIEP
ncbi:MAG: Uncharacterised protein [Chloroflexota bacterium]|jgi:hypothetical protein|nr:MAG: Uncharacterised protein [Chloroflexota bacterium]